MIKAGARQHSVPQNAGSIESWDGAATRGYANGDRIASLSTLRWIIGIRFKIGIILLTILFAANVAAVIPTTTTAYLAIANIIYLLTGFAYSYALKRPGVGQVSFRTMRLIQAVQVPEKLLLCTSAVYISGGVFSPLFIRHPLLILDAIILLEPTRVYRTGLLTVGFYCGLALLEVSGILPGTEGLWADRFAGEGSAGQWSLGSGNSTYALYVAIVSSVLLL